MTDTHSHILYDLDDGSSSIEESIELLKKLESVGFKHVILTPHFIESSEYQADNKEKLSKYLCLEEAIKQNKLNITIHLGNEIFIHNDILSSLENNLIYPLNNKKYLLIELPFHNQVIGLEDIIYEIKLKGYEVIIAHPERYSYLQEDYNLVDTIKEMGVLFQCNYASILGYYSNPAKKLFKYLLKKQYVEYLGTDIHHANKSYVTDNFKKIEKHIKAAAGKQYYQEIIDNCNALIKE